jgi:hypothetical protein
MATLTNSDEIKILLRNRGRQEGFNWRLIYQYRNATNGETAFAIFNEPQYNDMYQSPYVADVVLLMEDGYLTQDGAEFLGVNQNEFNYEMDNRESPYQLGYDFRKTLTGNMDSVQNKEAIREHLLDLGYFEDTTEYDEFWDGFWESDEEYE